MYLVGWLPPQMKKPRQFGFTIEEDSPPSFPWVCGCVRVFLGGSCSSSRDEHVHSWARKRHPFVGCFIMSRNGRRTGTFCCATFYLEGLPEKILIPTILDSLWFAINKWIKHIRIPKRDCSWWHSSHGKWKKTKSTNKNNITRYARGASFLCSIGQCSANLGSCGLSNEIHMDDPWG